MHSDPTPAKIDGRPYPANFFFEQSGKLGLPTLAAKSWCTHVVHGRSVNTIDPRIPTMPGRGAARWAVGLRIREGVKPQGR